MTKFKALPPCSTLWETFDYRPLTGELIWKVDTLFAQIGDVAGKKAAADGYKRVGLNLKLFRQHRIIWAWVAGIDPAHYVIDHIDGNKTNNRWFNLRLATKSQNNTNSKIYRSNTTGFKGVMPRPNGTYTARIWSNGKGYCLGTFHTIEAAADAYTQAAKRLHGPFIRTA
jgi:hypothetical protein